MNALAYLHIVGLVNSFVIRDNDRGKRQPDRNLCKEVNSTIYPMVGQTGQGLVKPIEQHRVERLVGQKLLVLSHLQPVNITKCADPGADCSGCKKKQNEHKVCSNHYQVCNLQSLQYCRSTMEN